MMSAGLRRWVAVCAAAEAIGMTAAAGAARYADHVLQDRTSVTVALAAAVIVTGGLVEGTALAVGQGVTLRRSVPSIRFRSYVLVTVLVAGLGWTAGSLPSLAASSSSAAAPAWWLMVLAGAGMGLVMGPLLGTAQALVLRASVRRPWTWVLANLLAWTPTMAVMMVGASIPSASWSTPVVLVWAVFVGTLAGALLGLVLGLHAPSLNGGRPRDRLVLACLRLGHPRSLCRSVVGLRITGRRSGRTFELPVMAAESSDGLVVAVGQAATKTWWRNVPDRPLVWVLRDRQWLPACAELLTPEAPDYADLRSAYQARWARARLADDDPIVSIQMMEAHPQDERSPLPTATQRVNSGPTPFRNVQRSGGASWRADSQAARQVKRAHP
ncbi:nitroreductase/quinone reductase family protein [Nocardioides sp.]|uniref:nitroreductase/quinone reductase family protein n=1 Tax=Nocardioides sp. TaxID=35761 RepID=UPI003D0A72A2